MIETTTHSNVAKLASILFVFVFVFVFFPLATAAQITVTNTDDSGTGSFRWAVDQANAVSGESTIQFDIPGGGPHFIQPITQYVSFLQPVIVDGTTQPGYAPGSPGIVLDGSQGGDISGLVFAGSADNSTVRGLSIINFEKFGIRFVSDSNIVQGNLIGIDPDGNPAGNGDGISMQNSVGNLIGGTTSEERNVISGNNIGVDMAPGSGNNVVTGNYIGTSIDGSSAVGNKFNVQIRGSSNNKVGGNTFEERNIIAGAFFEEVNGQNTGGSGVVLVRGTTSSGSVNPTGNIVQGNYIGTDVSGTVSLANERAGVLLLFGANENRIGGEGDGEGNVISGNGLYGVFLQGSDQNSVNSNRILGNYIGTDAAGSSALPNFVGIWNTGNSSANFIGSANGGNLISGNSVGAILIREGEENTIQGNLIGTDADGLQALPNESGVEIRGDFTTIGGDSPSEGNVISGNNGFGIYLNEASKTNVWNNIAGADISGSAAIEGQGVGIRISGGDGHLIRNNVISGNNSNGIRIDSNGLTGEISLDNVITGNNIGTDITGDHRIGNGGSGIAMFTTDNNQIGGITDAERNTISGNGGLFDGVLFTNPGILLSESSNNQISGNYIGTNSNGDVVQDFGNFTDGISIKSGSSDNIIGFDDTQAGKANIIAGNGVLNGNGVSVEDNSVRNRISGNVMFDNDGIGIDLKNDGISENDPDDPDEGPNNMQNFPVISSIEFDESANELSIRYSVPSDPVESNYPLRIEFFKGSANRQGVELIGSDSFESSDFGTEKEITVAVSAVSVGDEITNTATDNQGNTSEFGQIRNVTEDGDILFADQFESE